MKQMNVMMESYSILICLILAAYQIFHLDRNRRQKQWFLLLLLSNVGMMLGDLSDWMFSGVNTPLAGNLVLYGGILCFACSAPILTGLAGYLIEFMDLKGVKIRFLFYCILGLALTQVILSLVSPWCETYYYIDEAGWYQRGRLFALSQLIPFVMYLMNVALIWIGRKRQRTEAVLYMSAFILFPAIGEIIQIIHYGVVWVNIGATIGMLIVQINVQSEQEFIMQQKEKELTQMHMNIMISQIQPHFLYNSLTAIRQLCESDPAQAKQAIFEFSRFLRANMNALTIRERIPFSQELEHITNYLSLEKRRFGERLQVHYEIEAMDFTLPTLSVQPIVENAVRHGIIRRENGGSVTIATRKCKGGVEVRVKDDGVGFHVKHDGGRHIGLENVRSRLRELCKGDLRVESTVGVGTEVILWIPDESEE